MAKQSGGIVAEPLASGDPLATWARVHRLALFRFFHRRVRSDPDSEDLVQEVFLNLSRRGNLHQVERVEAYLFTAARNALNDWRRKQAGLSAFAHEDLDIQLPDESPSPEQEAIGRDELQKLLVILAQLPHRTQTIFVLYHFEGMTQAAIAKRLGIARRTVEDHMSRANARILNVPSE